MFRDWTDPYSHIEPGKDSVDDDGDGRQVPIAKEPGWENRQQSPPPANHKSGPTS